MKKLVHGTSRYEVIQEIAAGGMGSVLKARQLGVEGFEKVIAIKTLLPKFANDKEFVSRFIAEAKLVANLVHENIVQIYQLDKVSGEYFFVLEYVDGISLYDLIEFHKKLHRFMPIPLAVFIASRAARGLAYAHSRRDAAGYPLNIIHCDICPHNILINVEGVPKVTDFGIARASTMKRIDEVAGKLAFMAPEQCQNSASLTFAADIYSLGVVLFYMLSNQFTRNLKKSQEELIEEIRSNYINWDLLPESVPEELRKILRRMLAAKPQDRYADTSDLARELEFYIYKDGYGPTIVALANYMRELMPGRFRQPMPELDKASQKTAVIAKPAAAPADDDADKTMVLPEGYFDQHKVGASNNAAGDDADKTMVLPDDYFEKHKVAVNNADDDADKTMVLPDDYFEKHQVAVNNADDDADKTMVLPEDYFEKHPVKPENEQ